MIDKNCIHANICGYTGFHYEEDCAKCKFREYNMLSNNRKVVDVDKFMETLEDEGPDVCEHYELSETLHGYSYGRIKEVVKSCQEPAQGIVGVCIEHEWAEEYENRLISNFECPFCGEWHRDVGTYCSNCGKPIKIVYKERKKRE